jgi:DNA repair protein RadC
MNKITVYARLTVKFIYKRVCYQIIMSNSPSTEPQPSYVKLAMRNMVRKGGTSLKHFVLTTVGLLAVFVGLAYLTR